MRFNNHIIYGLAWVTYLIGTTALVPTYSTTPMIIGLVLFALSAWNYGVTLSLLFFLIYLPFFAAVNSIYFEFEVSYNANKVLGPIIVLVIIYSIGTLRRKHFEIIQLRADLERLVKDRTDELNEATRELIKSDEENRVSLSQDIHDGLGQYLTGLLLYSSSLQSEQNVFDATEIHSVNELIQLSQSNLSLARKIARTLFPINIAEAGMKIAILELVDYFSSVHDIQFSTHIDIIEPKLDHKQELYLYRIIYGAVLNEAYDDQVGKISIQLKQITEKVSLLILIDRSQPHNQSTLDESVETNLIRYRAHEIGGKISIDKSSDRYTRIECIV